VKNREMFVPSKKKKTRHWHLRGELAAAILKNIRDFAWKNTFAICWFRISKAFLAK